MIRLLAILLLAGGVLAGAANAPAVSDVEELRQRLTEAEEVAKAAREDAAQLRRANADLQAELTELRRQYAAMLLATDETAEKLSALDLDAAQLVRGADDESAAGDGSEGVRLLETLALCRSRLQMLSKSVTAYSATVRSSLAAVNASETLRAGVEASYAEVQKGLEECLLPLGLATDENLRAAVGNCAILRLDAATQLAILDQGSLHGLRLGQELTLRRGENTLATLQIVVLRPLHAAAVLTQGDFSALACGALLHR